MKRENKAYKITLSDTNYALPPFCTCCMRSTTEVEIVEVAKIRENIDDIKDMINNQN